MTPVADQTDNENQFVSLQVSASDADGDTLTYTATGLPIFLAIDENTGLISGTIDYEMVKHPLIILVNNVEVTVDDGTDSTTIGFTWTVNDVNRNPVAVADSANTMENNSVDVQVLDNDSDADGDSLVISNVTNPANGSVTDDGAIVTYTPDLNFNGADSFDYTVDDGFGGSATAGVSVNVTEVNDPPSVTTPDAQENTEDNAVSLQIAATDPDGDSLAYSAIGLPADLSIDPNSGLISGTVSFDAVAHPAIQDIYSVTVEVTDGINIPASTTFDWVVNDLNRLPDAVNDGPFNVVHDNELTIAVLSNDSDPDGDALIVVQITNHPANGSVVINGDNTLTYTPDAGFVGDDPFTYTIDDGFGGSDTATVQLTVTNQAPVAVDDLYGTDQLTSLNIPAPGVLGNDSDADGDSLSASLTATASLGSVSLNADGSFTYTPSGIGTDSFKYVASDGIADSNEATVTINVVEVNEPPTVEAPAPQTDAENSSVSLAVVATDPNGDTLTYSASGLPETLSIDINTGIINGTVSYDAVGHPDLSAIYPVTVVVDDGQYSDSATFDWTINDVNRDPVAMDDADTTDPDTAVTVVVLANDSDADGDTLSVPSITLNPLNGSVTINNDDTITYTPSSGFVGTDNFKYEVADGFGGTAEAEVTINVTNEAPVAVDDDYSTMQNETLAVTAPGVLENDTDADGDSLTAVLKSIPSNGSLTLNANGSFTYTPNTDFVGDDSFTYAAFDGIVESNEATVTITVSEVVNPPPVADAGGPYAALVDETISFDGSGSSDDGTIVSYEWDFGDGNSATGISPSHAYTDPGDYTVTLKVTDDKGATDSASTTATIDPIPNEPPVADAGGPYAALVGETISFNGSGSTDPDGSIVSYDWNFGDGSSGTGVSPSYAYADPGDYTVTLTVTDDQGATDQATTTATISEPENQLPVADANGPYTGTAGEAVTFDGSGSSDDGTIVSYDWKFGDGGSGTGVSPSHTYADPGDYTVTLTVTDDQGATDQATTTATISEPENLPPVADANGPYTGIEGEAVTFDGSGSSDPDGTIASYDWNFGDGSSGTGVSPSHIYADPGDYTVTLTVTDDQGATDMDTTSAMIDPAVIIDGADVFLSKMRVPNLLAMREGRQVKRRILIFGDGDTITQDATVTLSASSSDGAVNVGIESASITSSVEPGRPDTRFTFNVELNCVADGEHVVEWTATIDAAENADPTNDTLVGTTDVICTAASSRGTASSR